MCTVSWQYDQDGYQLFSNRDEKRSRRRAAPPVIRAIANGRRIIAPIDGDFGGTWISVNDSGVSLCLLNRYRDAVPEKYYTSRGLLVASLADSGTCEDAADRLVSAELNEFRPFTMIAICLGRPPMLAEWDGIGCIIRDAPNDVLPLVSSSVRPDQVAESRRELFRKQVTSSSTGTLRRFHSSHLPGPGYLSVCMHREDAETVSFSQISVTRNEVEFLYLDGPPCRTSLPTIVQMTIQ